MNVHEACGKRLQGSEPKSKLSKLSKKKKPSERCRGENLRWNPLARLDATGDIVGAERQRTR